MNASVPSAEYLPIQVDDPHLEIRYRGQAAAAYIDLVKRTGIRQIQPTACENPGAAVQGPEVVARREGGAFRKML